MSHLPITPPEGVGVVYPSCEDRTSRIVMPIRAAAVLRIGSDVDLCLTCGPDGSVYHPGGMTMEQIEAAWPRLAMQQDPTAADIASFDKWMRERFGSGPREA